MCSHVFSPSFSSMQFCISVETCFVLVLCRRVPFNLQICGYFPAFLLLMISSWTPSWAQSTHHIILFLQFRVCLGAGIGCLECTLHMIFWKVWMQSTTSGGLAVLTCSFLCTPHPHPQWVKFRALVHARQVLFCLKASSLGFLRQGLDTGLKLTV